MLLFKRKLTRLVGRLPPEKRRELDRALAVALDLAM
jgi:mRNA-degrading endonuclease toxin of MazEF toxin-antitoxin module